MLHLYVSKIPLYVYVLKALHVCLFLLCASQLATEEESVDALADNESVLIYVDSRYNTACKDVKSTFKEALREKKVKWRVKKGKYSSYAELAANVDKELLQSKVDRVIIALGHEEFWNDKANKATEVTLETIRTSIESTVQGLRAVNKKVILCTPHQLSAGRDVEANERFVAVAALIKEVASAAGIGVCDFYAAFDVKNKAGDPGKYNKGITTKDGVKPNDVGNEMITSLIGESLSLSGAAGGGPTETANLGRKLQKGDVITVAVPGQMGNLIKRLSLLMREAYKEEMNVSAPRAVGLGFAKDLFFAKSDFIDVAIKSNSAAIILYPGYNILGNKTYLASLSDGTFQTQLQSRIDLLKPNINCRIFLCTPLLWAEDDAGNAITVGGANYKVCQLWANAIKEVASRNNIAVIDLHQKCVDHVKKNGAGKYLFAGRRNTYKGETTWNNVDYTDFAADFFLGAISEAINFDYQAALKAKN